MHAITQAQQLIAQGKTLEAKQSLQKLLINSPEDPNVIFLLAQLLIQERAFIQAIPHLESCIRLVPTHPKPQIELASTLAELGKISEAEQSFQALINKFPQDASILFEYAGLLQSIGQFDRATELLRKSIGLQPTLTAVYLALAGLLDMSQEGHLVSTMEGLLGQLGSTSAKNGLDKMRLHYALGKSMDDCVQYDEAFNHWTQSNQIQLGLCAFRVKQMEPFFSQLKAEFKCVVENTENTDQNVAEYSTFTSHQLIPIFIVGLPRSGSTLLEQMLSCHSEIGTVGEVGYFADILSQRIPKLTGKEYPVGVAQISVEQWLQLGEQYLQKIASHNIDSKFIIDKLPANFQSIGAIRKALPMARIIHIERHPEAVALSIYRNYFAANEPYFCDLDELANYYHLYSDLMAFWQEGSEQECFSISYESLVSSPEEQLNRILKYFDLPWQSSCLSFHTNSSRVTTLSDQQVRQPTYVDKIDYWKHYQKYPQMQRFADKIAT